LFPSNIFIITYFNINKKEKRYNPYYGHLSNKFCKWKHSFKITFQYCFWDFFKLIPEYQPQKIKNVAKLLAFLIVQEAVGVIIFKVYFFPFFLFPLFYFFPFFLFSSLFNL